MDTAPIGAFPLVSFDFPFGCPLGGTGAPMTPLVGFAGGFADADLAAPLTESAFAGAFAESAFAEACAGTAFAPIGRVEGCCLSSNCVCV